MLSYQEILSAAQSLAPEERLRLATTLWEEAPPDDWPAPSAAWVAEVQRRSAEFDAGRMAAASWPEVRDRARRQVGLDD